MRRRQNETTFYTISVCAGAGTRSWAAIDVAAAGVGGPAFYVDGVLYRTVGTPTDFSGTGAPSHSYDTIYQFSGLQMNVATAAPGDPGFNGGRWMVRLLSFSNYAGALADNTVDVNNNNVLDSDEEVMAAIAEGYASDLGIVKMWGGFAPQLLLARMVPAKSKVQCNERNSGRLPVDAFGAPRPSLKRLKGH